ncbi:MAG: hypothetical protein K1X83_10750 [Oligoflexia bacterium]|nr:hypothetical protein [Oligoflexia bacterium]
MRERAHHLLSSEAGVQMTEYSLALAILFFIFLFGGALLLTATNQRFSESVEIENGMVPCGSGTGLDRSTSSLECL